MDENNRHIAWIHGSYHGRRVHMSALHKKFSGIDCFVSDNDISFEYLMTELQGTGCFDDKKFVVINDMPNFKDSNKQKYLKQFKKVLEELNEDIFVVINGISPKKERSLFNHVEKLGGKIKEFKETVDSRNAAKWVIDKLESKGYKIEENLSDAIVEANGFDSTLNAIGIDMLEMAVHRVINYQGNTKKISMDTIEATAAHHENFVIWDLLNAVDKKDYERCLELVSKSYQANGNVTSSIVQIMNMMLWKFRLLWFLKDKIAVTNDYTESAKAAILMKKLKGSGSGMSRTMEFDIVQTGDNKGQPALQWNKNCVREAIEGRYGGTPSIDIYSRRELYQIICAIQAALISIREITSENDAMLLVDTIFMTICKKGDYSKIRSIIKSFEEAKV